MIEYTELKKNQNQLGWKYQFSIYFLKINCVPCKIDFKKNKK